MKNLKLRKRDEAPAEKTIRMVRLVNQETPHGTFMRFVYLTIDTETGHVRGLEYMPVVYNEADEAIDAAAQIAQAAQMPVLEVKRLCQQVH